MRSADATATPVWALDANPLGLVFREAYQAVRELLDAQPRAIAGAVSDEQANQAAVQFGAALWDIHLALARRSALRHVAGSADQSEALQYAFAVLVDETLLNENWAGRGAWSEHLLEWRVFKTRSGGTRLFERMDAAARSGERASREIGEIYLYCLTLGFAGRLRDRPDGAAELAQRRAALFAWLYPDQPSLDDPAFVLAQAREENLARAEPHQRSLAGRLRVYLVASSLLAVPLLLSLVLWLYLRADLAGVLRNLPGSA
ncbi:DotU family type IV/VI secretion system protein [Pseudoduganella buxea]|nr:DotU family type IV/VI secretion system protein [Pseudoduganella buxea]GGC13502.1 hypothetical protein GCM10011572_38640 [Pseudoduganella buxea]